MCAVLVSLLVASACDEPGYRLVIRAHAEDEEVLVAGATLSVRLVDHQTRGGTEVTSTRLSEDLGTDTPAEIEITLHGGGQYDAHLMVVSTVGRWYATRCYQIGGEDTSDVLLVGPLDRETDDDGDGWPSEDDCRDPGGAACADPCPAIRANDCNDLDAEIHPAARDFCQDQIDQDCSGNDALCGEDEAGP